MTTKEHKAVCADCAKRIDCLEAVCGEKEGHDYLCEPCLERARFRPQKRAADELPEANFYQVDMED